MRIDGLFPVYVRCTMNGQRFEVATGFIVHHDNWNDSKQLIKGRAEDVKIINNRLEKIRTKVNLKFTGRYQTFRIKIVLGRKSSS